MVVDVVLVSLLDEEKEAEVSGKCDEETSRRMWGSYTLKCRLRMKLVGAVALRLQEA